MPNLLISPHDLRDAQRALYSELRSRGVPVSFVTAAVDEDGSYLEVGVTDGSESSVPSSFRDIRVLTRQAPRAVLTLGDRGSST